MNKINIGNDFGPLFMPVTIIGANVKNKANFMACGWFTRINMNPNIWVIGLDRNHYTVKGIKENKTFSINYPNIDIIDKTDYCGMISGNKENKSGLFEVFYGELKTAPMIKECPICMELSLREVKELPSGLAIFGDVISVFTENKYLTEGKADIEKINPLILTMPDANYRTIGKIQAKAWNIGNKLK